MIAILAEEVLKGEVTEFHCYSPGDSGRTVAHGELQLVGALGCQFVGDIYGTVGFVLLDIGLHFLGVEVAHACQVAQRTLDGLHVKQISRLGAQFTAYHVFKHMVVAKDVYLVESGLLAFADSYLKVHGVAHHVGLYGCDAVEYVTVVVVLACDGVIIGFAHLGAEALGEQLLIIDVAVLELQGAVECFGGVDGVAHPVDVAHIVFAALVKGEIHIHVLFVEGHHAVAYYVGIAVAPRVAATDHGVFVGGVFLGDKFLGSKEVAQLTHLAGLLHSFLERFLLLLVHAGDVDAVDFYFLVLVDIDVEQHLVGIRRVVALQHVDLHVLESFVHEVGFDHILDAVDYIYVDLVAGLEVELLL